MQHNNAIVNVLLFVFMSKKSVVNQPTFTAISTENHHHKNNNLLNHITEPL